MWRINNKGFSLEEVLIMAYMNILEARSSVPRFAEALQTRQYAPSTMITECLPLNSPAL
jgi:hypothetical protein